MAMMDKTTLRIMLALAGVVLLLGIYLWDRWKRRRRDLNETLETLDAALPEKDFEIEEIDTVSMNPAEDHTPLDPEVLEAEYITEEGNVSFVEDHQTEAPSPPPKPADLPEIIQISIVAPSGKPFRGPELITAFADLRLQYGEMDIFHYYQGNEIQFSLASMVKPGTFPIDAMETFTTPGLTLFMQPPLVSRPLDAFEQTVTTSHALAQRLGGRELDDRRQPLSSVKLSLWRRQLRGSD